MNSLYKIAIYFSLLASISSCREEKSIDPDFDKKVMAEIFPALMDSVWVEIRFSHAPPAITNVYDSSSKKTIARPIAKDQAFKQGFIDELKQMRNKDAVIMVVINDSIHKIDEEDKQRLTTHFQSALPGGDNDQASYKINLAEYKAGKPFKLIEAAGFARIKTIDEIPPLLLRDIGFSRIAFDKEKKFGVLTCEFHCGLQCGSGYRIFIKKLDNHWIVEAIEES